jgi:hypothetical protein
MVLGVETMNDNHYHQSPPFKTQREALDARDELFRLRKLVPKPYVVTKCHKCGDTPCEGSRHGHHCTCCFALQERLRQIAIALSEE